MLGHTAPAKRSWFFMAIAWFHHCGILCFLSLVAHWGLAESVSWFISVARVCGGSQRFYSGGFAWSALLLQPGNCELQCEKLQELGLCVENHLRAPQQEKSTCSLTVKPYTPEKQGLDSIDKCVHLLFALSEEYAGIWRKLLTFSLIAEATKSGFHFLRLRPTCSIFLLAVTLEKQSGLQPPTRMRKPRPCLSLWVTFPTLNDLYDDSDFPFHLVDHFQLRPTIASQRSSLYCPFLFQKGLYTKWKEFLMIRRHRIKVDKRQSQEWLVCF